MPCRLSASCCRAFAPPASRRRVKELLRDPKYGVTKDGLVVEKTNDGVDVLDVSYSAAKGCHLTQLTPTRLTGGKIPYFAQQEVQLQLLEES